MEIACGAHFKRRNGRQPLVGDGRERRGGLPWQPVEQRVLAGECGGDAAGIGHPVTNRGPIEGWFLRRGEAGGRLRVLRHVVERQGAAG